MSAAVRPRRVLSVAGLAAVWCGLWGDISPGTVIAGVAVATAVMAVGFGTAGVGTFRLVPLARLIGLVTLDLIRSTASVAAEIVTPTDSTAESIIAVEVPGASRDHLLLLVIAITLTPGTAVVDTDPDRGVLYLHLLHDHRRAATVDHVHQLARLACEALPTGQSEVTP